MEQKKRYVEATSIRPPVCDVVSAIVRRIFIKFRITQVYKQTQWQSRDALRQYIELLYTLQGQSVRRNIRVGLSARSGQSCLWVISLLHPLYNQPMWRSVPSPGNKGANGLDRQSNLRPDCTDVLKCTLFKTMYNYMQWPVTTFNL